MLQPAALRRSALIQGKAVALSINYHRFLSYDTKHRREGVSDKGARGGGEPPRTDYSLK